MSLDQRHTFFARGHKDSLFFGTLTVTLNAAGARGEFEASASAQELLAYASHDLHVLFDKRALFETWAAHNERNRAVIDTLVEAGGVTILS